MSQEEITVPERSMVLIKPSTEKPRRIVLSGWYGKGNLGDEAILHALVSELRSRVNALSITVLSEEPAVVLENHGLRSIRKTDRISDTVRRILEISRSDMFILGGGGILMDYGDTNRNISRWLNDMEIAQRLGVPTMTVGIGVGKIWVEESKKRIKKILPKARKVCVRDEHSAEALASLGVQKNVILAADPALLLHQFEDQKPRLGNSDVPTILVCLRHWYVTRNETVNEEVFQKMKESLGRVLSLLSTTEHARIIFVPFSTNKKKRDDDTMVAQEVAELMGNPANVSLLDHVPSVEEFILLLGDSSLLIGMRLHSLIIASSTQLPCIGISYDDKVMSFMSSIGASNWTLSLEEASYENLVRLAETALKQPQSPVITRLIQERKESAKKNIDIAVELLHENRSKKTGRRLTVIYLIARTVASRLKKFVQKDQGNVSNNSGASILDLKETPQKIREDAKIS